MAQKSMRSTSQCTETGSQFNSTLPGRVEMITTTGKEDIESKELEELLELAESSETNRQMTSKLIFDQLRIDHAQVRYSALLLLNELVRKSSIYRETLFSDNDIMLQLTRLTVDCVTKKPKGRKQKKLQPHFVTDKLRLKALEFLVTWDKNYGSELKRNVFPKILKYIKNDLGLSLPKPSLEASRPDPLTTQAALDILRQDVFENESDINQALVEIKSLFEILVPPNDDHEVIDLDSDEEKQKNPSKSEYFVPVVISTNGLIDIVPTEDNEAILENLLGLYKLINARYLPMVKRWLERIDYEGTLYDTWHDADLEDRLDQMKRKLLFEKSRYERINIKKEDADSSDSDDDDSDFEEVRSTPEWMELPCLGMATTLGSGSNKTTELQDLELLKATPAEEGSIDNSMQQLDADDLDVFESFEDQRCRVPLENGELCPRKYFEICAIHGTIIPRDKNGVPLKEPCKAVLPNGKLCPRRDLEKCPFHGLIIPRDAEGVPIDTVQRELEKQKKLETEAKAEDWQNPALLRDLKRKIGLDLTVTKKRKPKLSFEERYPNLISLKAESTKQRLLKKMHKMGTKQEKIRRREFELN